VIANLTARCKRCGGAILPRRNPYNRNAICNFCSYAMHRVDWLNVFRLGTPDFDYSRPKVLECSPTDGDLLISMLTGRGYGTKAWFIAASGHFIGKGRQKNDYQALSIDAFLGRPALILDYLETLGHLVQNQRRSHWLILPSFWVRDRSNPGMLYAAGARDRAFWLTFPQATRRSFVIDIPPKVSIAEDDISMPVRDLFSECLNALRPIASWVKNQPRLEKYHIPASATSLTSQLKSAPMSWVDRTVINWRLDSVRKYAVVWEGDVFEVPAGIARQLAVGFLPYFRKDDRIAIPGQFRCPIEYERPLIRCGGVLPRPVKDSKGHTWHVYEGIEDDVLRSMRSILKLEPIS
jgi:hypothetical protein